jgi:hypothetical protein
MLFMRAEALAQLGRAEDALADLDGVREDFYDLDLPAGDQAAAH